MWHVILDRLPYYGKQIIQCRYFEYIPDCGTLLEMGRKILNNLQSGWQCMINGKMANNIYLDDFSALQILVVPYNDYKTSNH